MADVDVMDAADFGLSTDVGVLDEVPLERLEAEISGFASRLASATAAWLLWVAAYDRRQGWESWEAKSCAHWLNWHCGMSPRAAREHVAVARKLEDFGLVRGVFLAGELSYSKVRAICRVVEAANEQELVEIAKLTTASQLDRIVAKMPRPGTDDGAESVAPSQMSWRDNHDGTATISVTVAIEESLVAREAVNSRVTAEIERESAEGESRSEAIERLGGIGRLRADTAVALLSSRIDLAQEPEAEVLVVADIDALTGTDDDSECTISNRRIPSKVARRLCCDAMVEAAVLGDDGEPVGIGRRSRIVPRSLRRLVLRRDHGMCQFPGCESDRRLHAHHVIHWAHGGPTDLDNLVSLCHFHHGSVHEGGWNMRQAASGWTFVDPAGVTHQVPVLRLPTTKSLPPSKSGAAAPLGAIGERCNTHYIADILIANTATASAAMTEASAAEVV